jgi:tetratricopeptide (TPR) repeat protein
VRALRLFPRRSGVSWADILDETYLQRDDLPCDVSEYARLMERVLHLPAARRSFITSCIRWTTARRVPVSEESILLAATLCAGSQGGVPLTTRVRAGQGEVEPLATCLGKHVFTTNFDDVLPLAFNLTGRPVEILDQGSGRTVDTDVDYPTIVYLHGRHLHYDMRNTATELIGSQRESGSEESVFAQFRRLLRSTGLVVIGYSGAEDRVMAEIESAALDGNSLPYGLWWGAYPSIEALSDRARRLVAANERARFLEPGKDAEHVMRALAHEVGVQEASVLQEWLREAGRLGNRVRAIMGRDPVRLRRFHAEIEATLASGDEASVTRLLRRWETVSAAVDELGDRSLAGDILASMNLVHFFLGDPVDAIDTATRAVKAYADAGDQASCASQEEALALAIWHRDDFEGAEQHARSAVDMHRELEDERGLASSLGVLANILSSHDSYPDAHACRLEALQIYESLGDRRLVALAHGELGDLMNEMEVSDAAESHYRTAFELAREGDDDSELSDHARDLAAF